jgi:hypothetical protein
MQLTDMETELIKEIFDAYSNKFINAEIALGDLEQIIKGEEPMERACVSEYCAERLDKDIWKEELGMCVECSNAYYTHEEEKEN